MKQTITVSQINGAYKDSLITLDSRDWALSNLQYLNKPITLLSSSYKTKKGEKYGYMTSILYLQPADKVAVKTLCASAELSGCKDGCLISSGQLGMKAGQDAATKRTILFILYKNDFEEALLLEIDKLSKKHGDSLAIRLNGTSDIDFAKLVAQRPAIVFYDYTKIYQRLLKNTLSNYHLTFSGSAYSDKTISMTARAIKANHNVAIAFNSKEVKGDFITPSNMTSFDDSDLRFLDVKGTIGKLTRKGSSKADRQSDMLGDSFFFKPETYTNLIDAVNIT